ncbi:MAG TPA: precorrin-3B C(17)-methyltransferase [Acidimicrobiales bacterium]
MNRVVCCSITSAGEHVARKLPYEHRHGNLVTNVSELWERVDGFILVSATGVAVRAIAPHLNRKTGDPAVVCVDDHGTFAIALSGGHAAGANRLALDVAGVLGATPVITTATDSAGLPALDNLPGLIAEGDVATITRLWLDGSPPALRVDVGLEAWPLPEEIRGLPNEGAAEVLVTDRLHDQQHGPQVRLRPSSLVLGVGSSSGADAERLWELAMSQLQTAGLDARSVGLVATLDRKLSEPAIRSLAERLGVELRGFEAALLAGVDVPNPSEAAERAVGTASVCEAAALLASGPGSVLLSEKAISSSADSTVAIARRRVPEGHLAVVGIGPGHPSRRTAEANIAIRHADVVIGYSGYVEQASDLVEARHRVICSPIGAEEDRCREALKLAAEGFSVALVCSGDPGVYAMASLVCELGGEYGDPPLSIVPGVTAALSGAAVLGAPLGHDHAAISLSDLLTPWEEIVRRLEAAAAGDFVVSLYNPRSFRRSEHLGEALKILASRRAPSTPAAVLTDIGRPGESVSRTTLGELDPSTVGMLSLVVVGSTSTRWIGERMVTPRGYRTSEP